MYIYIYKCRDCCFGACDTYIYTFDTEVEAE